MPPLTSSTYVSSDLILQTLVASMPIVTFVLDGSGIIQQLHAGNLASFGPKAVELVGRSIYSVYRYYPEILQECERALKGEKFANTIELLGFTFNVWFTPIFDNDGTVASVIGIASDITEQKRATDLLQQQASLLYSVSDALVATDENLVIESWNYAAEGVFGWREDEVIGQFLPELLKLSAAPEPEQDVIGMTFRHGLWRGELLLHHKDGRPLNVLAALSLAEQPDGPATIVAVFHDITERKRAEERALQLSIENEKILMLKEFIADASHDLRTPITTIQTSTYLLRRKFPELDSINLDTIELQATHLGRLVDDLVTLSRLDADMQQYMSPIPLNSLIETICNSLQETAAKEQQTLTFAPDPRISTVNADEVALVRAITNLIANALNYTPERGTISVSTQLRGDQVAIKVTDTGIGIASEDLSRIFDRFYRVNKARATDKGGTGLGLAITKKIVETHSGTIEAKSDIGQGSTFTILLPIQQPKS